MHSGLLNLILQVLIIETSIEEVTDLRGNPVEILESMGGGKAIDTKGKIKFYELENGDRISMKYSKMYDRDPPYWYGITPDALKKYNGEEISHLVFILGNEGFIKLPFTILKDYINEANTSLYPDGSVRHYHIFIKNHPKHFLYTSKKAWDIEEHFFSSED